ncbi:MAG TPA: S41 family peptidase [Aggregatilineaceae bacterium]|nr:S41 family peptidase [Aggregatilineaceae bacterium]
MQDFNLFRRLAASGAIVILLLAVAAGGYGILVHDNAVEAQGNQPADTLELFNPFWETWALLHENYVDPLDDQALMEGALTGLLQAANDPYPISDFLNDSTSELSDPSNTDELFKPFWDAWTQIHAEVTAPLDDNALMESALSSMMEAIGDPHTDYMPPEVWQQVNESMSGAYEGIGAVVGESEEYGGLELVSIMDGSPAEKAGLHPGDVIVEVEGQDVTDLSQNEIIALVRGPAGTLVRLGVMREDASEMLKFEVKRDRISIPSVTSEVLDGNIGYVRLSQFEFETGEALRDALTEMNANELDGLILDLRGDPGGYLTTAIDVGSVFITEGPIVIERSPGQEYAHEALGNAVAPDVPMVVLVDQGSASASELIAGALQDTGRATVVGMQTFGKGSVQTWRELSNGGGIRITISRWYTPDGNSVSEVGITPDVEVPYDPDAEDDNQLAAALAVLQATATGERVQ